MTDDFFDTDGGSRIGAEGSQSSVTRRSTSTDSLDTMFDVLSNARRRHLLYHLAAVDESVVELEAAVDAVSDYEADRTETVDQSPREDITIALHHNHLPRLAETRILDYDSRQGTIRLTGDDEFEEWVEFAQSRE